MIDMKNADTTPAVSPHYEHAARLVRDCKVREVCALLEEVVTCRRETLLAFKLGWEGGVELVAQGMEYQQERAHRDEEQEEITPEWVRKRKVATNG